jgi:hypothetical protein
MAAVAAGRRRREARDLEGAPCFFLRTLMGIWVLGCVWLENGERADRSI